MSTACGSPSAATTRFSAQLGHRRLLSRSKRMHFKDVVWAHADAIFLCLAAVAIDYRRDLAGSPGARLLAPFLGVLHNAQAMRRIGVYAAVARGGTTGWG